jgi:dephospho-CoA kinase
MTPNRKSKIENRKWVIGLLGGIGAGKSAVAAEFAARGGRIISGDALGHAALRQPELREQIVARWGAGLLDASGEIDRKKLGAIVFGDVAERRALEALVFPWIKAEMHRQIEDLQADPAAAFVILDAAVMLEAGWDGLCDRLVFIDTPREVRLARIAAQRGWSEREVEAREHAQMPPTEKARRADHVLDNSGSLEQLQFQIDQLLLQWGVLTVPEHQGQS